MDRTHDEERVREVELAYDRAWIAADIDAVLACLTDDAVVVTPRGEVAHGKAEFRELLSAFLNGPAHGSVHESRIVRIDFVTADVAIVSGEASIYTPERLGALAVTHRFTDILVHKQGSWKIAHIRACPLVEAMDKTA